jgi:hypothetical protein
MISAFGVEHGGISKAMAPGVAINRAVAQIGAKPGRGLAGKRAKLMPAVTQGRSIGRRKLGGGVHKGFNSLRPGLEAAVATAKPGSAAHAYATSRLAAGQHGAGVAGNLRAAGTALKPPKVRNIRANSRIAEGNKQALKAARGGRKAGASNKRAAAGVIQSNPSRALPAANVPAGQVRAAGGRKAALSANTARRTAGPTGIAGTEAPAAAAPTASRFGGFSRRNLGFAVGSGAVGGAAGGGGAVYANRRRTA